MYSYSCGPHSPTSCQYIFVFWSGGGKVDVHADVHAQKTLTFMFTFTFTLIFQKKTSKFTSKAFLRLLTFLNGRQT